MPADRVLTPEDLPALTRFLVRHPDTTLILHGNGHTAGLVDEGRPYQGAWAAACDGCEVVGVAAGTSGTGISSSSTRRSSRQ